VKVRPSATGDFGSNRSLRAELVTSSLAYCWRSASFPSLGIDVRECRPGVEELKVREAGPLGDAAHDRHDALQHFRRKSGLEERLDVEVVDVGVPCVERPVTLPRPPGVLLHQPAVLRFHIEPFNVLQEQGRLLIAHLCKQMCGRTEHVLRRDTTLYRSGELEAQDQSSG
jgi:hypothetical protein